MHCMIYYTRAEMCYMIYHMGGGGGAEMYYMKYYAGAGVYNMIYYMVSGGYYTI